jgi:hypothetical protein
MNTTPIVSAAASVFAAMLSSVAAAQSTCPLLGIDSATTTTATLWDISTTTGAASNPRTVSGAPNRPPLCIDFAPSGVLYGVSLGAGGFPASGMLFTIDPTTGAATFVANLTQFVNVEGDIAIDPTTGILYAVDGIGPLFTIDTSTGVCTTIGSLPLDLPGGADYSGLAFDGSGQLWVWSQFGQVLRKVNKANAAIQATVPLAPNPGGGIGDVVFDPGTGRCFLGGNPTGGILSEVNPATGVVTPIGSTAPMAGVFGLASRGSGCARANPVGSGCTKQFASFYELQAGAFQDLAGQQVIGTYTGSGYVITTVPGPGITMPIGLAPLSLGDNTSVAAGTLGMWVGSNGWLALGPGNTTAPVPSIPALLNQPSPQLSAWTDLDPSSAGGGQVYYWEPSPTVGQATWLNVLGKNSVWPNTIQITWDLASRNWTIEFGTLSPFHPHAWLVGYSPAGPSADPGQSDISTFGGSPHSIALFDVLPLTLAAVGRPIQGLTAAPFTLVTTNIDPAAILHFGIVGLTGFAPPGVPLSGFGLPADCYQLATVDIMSGPHPFPVGSQTWTALTLPALPPSFSGLPFTCQSVTLTAAGLGPSTRVSNGIRCVVGPM